MGVIPKEEKDAGRMHPATGKAVSVGTFRVVRYIDAEILGEFTTFVISSRQNLLQLARKNCQTTLEGFDFEIRLISGCGSSPGNPKRVLKFSPIHLYLWETDPTDTSRQRRWRLDGYCNHAGSYYEYRQIPKPRTKELISLTTTYKRLLIKNRQQSI